MDLKAIRDHLSAARSALGPEHPLASRLERVERALTPGDAAWRDDAVSAENDLLAISTALESQQKVAPAQRSAPAEVPPGVNQAIKHIADALELL